MTAPRLAEHAIAPTQTGAEALIEAFAQAGVTRIFGVPGGGSSLDLVEAAKRRGLDFVLARHEFAAVVMAATTGELSGTPGVALCTRGPGVGNAANGLAHAALDRAPVVLVADGFTPEERAFATHQWFDHAAMMAPVTKAALEVGPVEASQAAAQAVAAVLAAPRGAALIELSGAAARGPTATSPLPTSPTLPAPGSADLDAARDLLSKARRPAAVVGLEACEPAACSAVRRLVAALGCPALVTYKAKGVVPDDDPHFGGVFTAGDAEAPIMAEADAILLLGADPVEFIPKPWRWKAPVLDLGTTSRSLHYRAPTASIYGALDAAVAALAEGAPRSTWTPGAIAAHREEWRARLANQGGGAGLGPQAVVEIAQAVCRRAGADPRLAIDAGAHMFPATTFWQCRRPGDLLISNGLATMGFAVPAGIAAALHDPERGAMAFIGDGGLLMNLGELATAATLGIKLVVVVFNDACLSLIDIKKGGRDLPDGALGWPRTDFAAVMRAMGGLGLSASTEAEYEAALMRALEAAGPVLIDVTVDPSGYPAQIKALRG